MGGAHKGREFGNWESDNAWDIFSPDGTPVYAFAPGTVKRVKVGAPPAASSKVYGDQVSLTGLEGAPSTFYTHIRAMVQQGQVIKAGDLIGTIMKHDANPQMPIHVHVGIDQKKHIKDFVKEDGTLVLAAGGGGDLMEFASDFDGFMNKHALTIASVGVAIMTVSLLSARRPAYANPVSHLSVAR